MMIPARDQAAELQHAPMHETRKARASSRIGVHNCLQMLAEEAAELGMPLVATLIAAASAAALDDIRGGA